MSVMYRSPALENNELMALYGEEREIYFEKDEDCISEENDQDSECSEDGSGDRGNSLSLEIYGLQKEERVYFSNQEYYRRLEELKSAHLRNMADLERMYISQGLDRHEGREDDEGLGRGRNNEEKQTFRKGNGTLFGSGPTRRLQRINSQEELDFRDTSSGSDQSELSGEDFLGELGWTSNQRTFQRKIMHSPEHMMAKKNFRFQPKASCPKPQRRLSYQTGARAQSNSKVTVPKPFQMMLREEERKRHRVRTRSEVELENTLLRRELEELRECQKKFRASPAPAHIHLPLYEIISRRPRGRGSFNNIPERSQEPFQFLGREKKKREARIAAELGNFGRREERQGFKATPLPSSVYHSRHAKSPNCHHQLQTVFMMEREATEAQSDQSSDLEQDAQQSDGSLNFRRPQRGSSIKSVRKQIELSIEMKERK
ncbi:protein FAM161A [Anableps anableps]